MFPIRDRRGRVISFGGRTLGRRPAEIRQRAGDARCSPSGARCTALDLAREAARGGAALVVVEGYMDVIALHQAGFGGAVAPLGTALTEEQLEELWRLSPAPVLCFDGDAAGGRAAARAAELALPMLAPERTLAAGDAAARARTRTRWSAASGPRRSQAVLGAARPLADALFDLLREGSGDHARADAPRSAPGWRRPRARIPDKALAQRIPPALLDRFFAPAPAGNGRNCAATPRGRCPGLRRGQCATAGARPHPDRHPAAPSRPAARRGARLRRPRLAAATRAAARRAPRVGGNR